MYWFGLLLVAVGLVAILRQLRADDWKLSLEVLGPAGGLATFVVSIQLWHRKAIGRAAVTASSSVMVEAKSLLAESTWRAWSREAQLRDQAGGKPIPVTWQYVTWQGEADGVALAGAVEPKEAIRQANDMAAAFLGWESRQLIVIGAPGMGKTTVAMQLTLALLRPITYGQERPPLDLVPLFVSAANWSPDRGSFTQWIAQELSRMCPEVPSKGHDIPRRLVDAPHVVPVLDGLDEIAAPIRAEVFAALSDVRSPLILTCRTEEFEQATRSQGGLLSAARIIRPLPLTPAGAAVHLRGALPKDPATGWPELLTLLESADSYTGSVAVLAAAVATPLDLGLLRTTYIQNRCRSPEELLRPDRFTDERDMRGHLFDLLIADVLERRRRLSDHEVPSHLRPRRPHKPEDVRLWLGFLASRMAGTPPPGGAEGRQEQPPATRDLSWWSLAALTLPRWVLPGVQIVTWAVLGAVTGATVGTVAPSKDIPGAATGAWGLLFVAALLCGGLGASSANDILYSGPRYSSAGVAAADRSRQRLRRDAIAWVLGGALLVAAIVVITYATIWLWHAVTEDSAGAFLPNAGERLLFGLTGGALGGLLFALFSRADSALEKRVNSPGSSLRADRYGGLLRMLLVLSITGPLIGWTAWQQRTDHDVVTGMLLWSLGTVGFTLFSGRRAWFAYAVAVAHAACRRRLPLQLMPFLDDAYRLGLLRAVGPVYQFRHAEFQDYLANWYRETHAAAESAPDADAPPHHQGWSLGLRVLAILAAIGIGISSVWDLIRSGGSLSVSSLVSDCGGIVLMVAGGIYLAREWREHGRTATPASRRGARGS
ncbi:hypothetical protein ACIRU3_43500 [Streptomyces sp. NPDC101151]|uniref:hypothetical protein n=1 Tax=Streptomyces sp. NPDC101151 TaxID=3366115 RepID=UPI00380C4042